MKSSELPLVLWKINCFDKRRSDPLPVYGRSFLLDWGLLSEHQIEVVLDIVEAKRISSPTPTGFESSVLSISQNAPRSHDRITAFRRFFIEIAEEELNKLFLDAESSPSGFQFINPDREYFEDEAENEITQYQMIQHISGQEFPIIFGDVECILRLGASTPRNTSEWTVKSANLIGQFLDVVKRISNSSWRSTPHSISFEIRKNGDSSEFPKPKASKLLEANFPGDSATMEILPYFRQLHAGDKLLIRACDTFVRTCSDERKNAWINERKESFMRLVDSPPVPFNIPHSRRDVLKMFMYGAGMLHSESNDGADVKLGQLIESQGKQRAITILNSCLFDFLRVAATVYKVIQPDFENWIKHSGIVGPDRLEIRELFQPFPSNK